MFSPLDEELGLLPPARLSPRLLEGVVRLGTWLPFGQVPRALAFFWQVEPDPETARRLTEAAGAAQVAWEEAEVERLERDGPPAPPGPARLQVSVDGALVPLVGGQWAEAKTLAVGSVPPPTWNATSGEWEVHTTELSYFSRLADAEAFTRLATGETHRRGVETAATVVAPVDGSDWCQGFLDVQRPDAVRILDFAHAVEHLASAAQASLGAASGAWVAQQAHELKHGDPQAVLQALGALPVESAADPVAAAPARDATLGYLEKRREQIQYAAFQALGYPIGSGAVESANKLAVEDRLKGAGMHWARQNVNPMLALRGLACSNRWEPAWPPLWRQLRQQVTARRRRRPPPRPAAPPPTPSLAPLPVPGAAPAPAAVPTPTAPRRPLVVNGRPTAEHPWRKPFLRRCDHSTHAKL